MAENIIIALFALLAGLLFFRLRQVLGRRNGTERPRVNPLLARGRAAIRSQTERRPAARGQSALTPAAAQRAARPLEWRESSVEESIGPQSLADKLRNLHKIDPAFDELEFLTSVRVAFPMIVEAFAAGNLTELRPLLADQVYTPFAAAIAERNTAGETLEIKIQMIRSIDLNNIQIEDKTAHVTVEILSDQVKVLRDKDGTPIDQNNGASTPRSVEIADIWTFTRNTSADEPNWLLVATRSRD